MEQKTTRRAPEHPKKAQKTPEVPTPTVEAKEAVKEAPKRSKKILRKKKEEVNSMYTIPKGGGIVYMLKQKGVTVYDEKTDVVRAMRYCPNEQSIWLDEQGVNARKEAVVFRDGNLMVAKNKPNLKEFLELHPMNISNGGTVFEKVDTTKDSEVELQKEFSKTEAVSLVRDKDINDLLTVAIYYGIDVNKSTSDIRYELLKTAKKNPTEFIKAFDSPQVVAKSAIRQAADYQIIDIRNDGVYWFDSGGLIVSVPVGAKADDVMTRFCLTEKGSTVLDALEEKMARLA
tara:strand:+ start:243 stop:1103 length:861 start_codon:yes stop_codon:yes gene_type:complete